MRQATFLLPGGYWDASGVLHREAELIALTGREEELLADKTAGAAAGLVTALLARCMRGIGTVRPVTEDVARELPVGDRQYLLIKLRQLTCGDQEALTPLLARNEAEALTQLLCRCICSIGAHERASEEHVRNLSPAARLEIERQMERAAPGVNLVLAAKCPQCARAFPVPFDAEDFLFGEVRHSRDLLYREIHYLAYHYHWSEREILEMTRDRRRGYIEILSDEMERLNSAAG